MSKSSDGNEQQKVATKDGESESEVGLWRTMLICRSTSHLRD